MKRGEGSQPFLAAGEQVLCGQRIGEFLQTCEIAASKKCIRGLFKIDTLPSAGGPASDADSDTPARRRESKAHANEHSAPPGIVEIEVVLCDPAPLDFSDEVYSVGFVWNQPYLSFDHERISAPYANYIHFEHAGVERARELNKALCDNVGEPPGPRALRRCFGRNGAEHFTDMMSRLKGHPSAE